MPEEDDLTSVLSSMSATRTYREMESVVWKQLDALVASGSLSFGPDHQLGGKALESRVRMLFASMGFPSTPNTTGVDVDLIVPVPENYAPRRPLAVEIKSASRSAPDRGDLRQLDDWVFELSGEGRARRKNFVTMPMGNSLGPSPRIHPSPHKGVFVFNGPLGTAFDARPTNWLGANEVAFAEKRYFCVARFETLLRWGAVCTTDERRSHFWKVVQETGGMLVEP